MQFLLTLSFVVSLISQATGIGELQERYDFYRRAGLTAFLQADYKQAENAFRDALAEARSFGPFDTRVVTVLGDLALLYAKTGLFREAEELLQQSVTILQNNDPKHDLSIMLNARAEVYLREGRLRDAERTLAVALSLARNGRGATDATVADILDNLGALQLKQKKYRQAEESFQQSLEIRKKTPAAQNFKFVHALNDLGVLYAKQRRYSKAEEVLERSLKIAEADFPPYHPDLAFVLENLAVVENKLRHFEVSETCFRRILAIQTEERVMGRPEFLAVYADTLRNVNKQEEADIVLAKMKRVLDQQRFIIKSNRP